MLPINFHQTFVPERRLLAAILDFAALGKQGSYLDISAETGIPMGKSSGKAKAILDYARGMGLVKLDKLKGTSVKAPKLTPFGEVVYLEDKNLGEPMVQWLAHMNLCRSDIGAKLWHTLFAEGSLLGTTFLRKELENYIAVTLNLKNTRSMGPLISTYIEDAAFARAKVLSVSGEQVTRHKAPLLESFAWSYSAYITHLMEIFFPKQTQVTLTDFNTSTKWFEICQWNQREVEQALQLVEQKGYLSVDRQMHPWIIEKRFAAEQLWPKIFSDLA